MWPATASAVQGRTLPMTMSAWGGRSGISRASFAAHTADLTPDLHIMELLDRQPEFTKSFWDYLDLLVTENRIARGREMLAQHASVFEAVERTYGVDRHVIAAIWGIDAERKSLENVASPLSALDADQ